MNRPTAISEKDWGKWLWQNRFYGKLSEKRPQEPKRKKRDKIMDKKWPEIDR